MNNLFIVFIFVVIFALAILPILAVKSNNLSENNAHRSGNRGNSPRRKRNRDSVNAKVAPVRKVTGASGDEDYDYIGTIEFDTGFLVDKSVVVDEDIDSFIVTGSLTGVSVSGFDYSNTKGTVFHDCRVISKSAVTAFYKDYSETQYFYKNRPVQVTEHEGILIIEVYDGPVAYLKEFSVTDRAVNGKHFKVYYKEIESDDPNFKEETKHFHEDLTVDTYGITPETRAGEYNESLTKYLLEKIKRSGSKPDAIRRLVLGTYGYRFPDDELFTDIETVFDKIIPARYRQLDERSVSRSNFRRDLLIAITSGYKTVGCNYGYTIVDGDRSIEPSFEYSYYICLILHLMLLKYHKAGRRPYVELDLSDVWSRLEDGFKMYAPTENHNPVYHRDVCICEDLGAFTIEALTKLIYFKKFDKSENAKNATE
jgi:hypothetical protein